MLCLWTCGAVGLKCSSETAHLILASYFLQGCISLYSSWTSGCHGFLCFLIISIPLALSRSQIHLFLLPNPLNRQPTFSYFLWGSYCLALPSLVEAAEKAIFFFHWASLLLFLLFNSDHVNHQSEGGLWMNLVPNLNWLEQRQCVFGLLLRISLFSAFAH